MAPVDPPDGLPLALAAVSVDGRCRERNPADLAIFGAAGERLVERFADRAEGQALLAAAVRDGAAETVARLVTGGGEARFRVSLWRQRGGERIRLLAAFASVGQAGLAGRAAPGAACAGTGCEPAQAGVDLVARALRGPLAAAIGLAERLRRQAGRLGADEVARAAGDILAAGWRLRRLADDLLLAGRDAAAPPPSLGEVDAGRLLRRILRLAEPGLESAGVALGAAELPEPGAGPLLLADESTLWTALEGLLAEAALRAGAGGTVEVSLAWPGRSEGLAIAFAARSAAGGAAAPEGGAAAARGEGPDPALCARLVAANGGTVETAASADGAQVARALFPAGRLLDPA